MRGEGRLVVLQHGDGLAALSSPQGSKTGRVQSRTKPQAISRSYIIRKAARQAKDCTVEELVAGLANARGDRGPVWNERVD